MDVVSVFCDDDFLDNRLVDLHSSSSDSGDEVETIISSLFKRDKRNSIKQYVEEIVPKYSDKEFLKHFRINKTLFDYLVLRYKNCEMFKKLLDNRRTKNAEFQMLLFLWFAGHEGTSFCDLSDRFDISISSVSRIIHRVTLFISSLSKEFIRWPDESKMKETAEYYNDKFRFPGIVGSIDGTHIHIDPPRNGKDDYIDRKGDITIHLQGICNEEKKFIDVFIGYPGSVHDSRVFKNSTIYKKLPDLLCTGKYILGDSAYPCTQHLLSPYRDNGHLSATEKNFNYKLSQCRVDIENSFGILKQRFRKLYYCKLKGMEKLCHFIRACCVLHNMSKSDEIEITDNYVKNNMCENIDGGNEDILQDTALGKALRNQIAIKLPKKMPRKM